jgi:hypothetical protein
MGEWDCYCMLCCGPLAMRIVEVGNMETKALRKREKRVRQKAREHRGLEGAPGGDEMEDSDDTDTGANDDNSVSLLPKPPLASTAQNELYHGWRPGDKMYDYYEECSYDPRIVNKKDVAWLDQCRTLGFNAFTKRAYITGLGQYESWGDFAISEPGTDPMDPHRNQGIPYPCYLPDGGEIEDPTYPFHEACYAILAKRLGFADPTDIDKTVMYKAARTLCKDDACCLTVDYGVEGGDQFWTNRPGEEVSPNNIF